MATFEISSSSNAKNHGLVIVGQITSGEVQPGDQLKFQHENKEICLKIKGIEHGLTVSGKPFTGFVFNYEDELQQKQLENMKVVKQVAVITS